MSFLDSSGLSYFYSKLKEKFVRSITTGKEILTPDTSGNVTITNVPTADNLTSPDNQTSYDKYIFRTSGGSADLTSGPAELMYIEGNMSVVGRQEEILNASANNGITIEINAPVWRASAYGEESGTYTFNYSAGTASWTPLLGTYGLTATGVYTSEIYGYGSGSIESVTVDTETWETKITTSGTYYFYYTDGAWIFNETLATLSNYGIEIVGTPEQGDMITITYTAPTPNSVATVNYTKGELGTIYVAKPSTFSATGFNQCDPSSMVLNNMTISSNGYITGETDSYVCYCKAVGGVTNGYVAYSSGGHIKNIGWCAGLPQEASSIVLTNASASAEMATVEFNDNGYVVVSMDSAADICIHPRWSGAADLTYEAYVEPSVITLPSAGTVGSQTRQLPLAIYGMPAIGAIADKMDLEGKTYTQRIGRYSYSAQALASVEALGVPYEYDANYIYYVLENPIIYAINVSSNYTVSDWGTEEFTGTQIAVGAQTLYAQNLRDKLRNDVLTISAQELTEGQQSQVYENLNLKSFHLNDTITAFPKVISDDRINTTMSIANVVLGTPSAVTSDIGWTTTSGAVTFTGTLASGATTTINFDVAPILSVAEAEIDQAAIEAEVNSFLDNLEDSIDNTKTEASAVLESINDELQALQSGAAVELKKLQFNNVTMESSAFASDSSYGNYGYRGALVLTDVISSMTPTVVLSNKDATSGNFAPVAETYNGGVYLYASQVPEEDLIIPTIICWRGNG